MTSSEALSTSSSSVTLNEMGSVEGFEGKDDLLETAIPGLKSVHVRKGKRELIKGRELKFKNGFVDPSNPTTFNHLLIQVDFKISSPIFPSQCSSSETTRNGSRLMALLHHDYIPEFVLVHACRPYFLASELGMPSPFTWILLTGCNLPDFGSIFREFLGVDNR